MAVFLIPFLIILGIFAFEARDELVGRLDFLLPDFRLPVRESEPSAAAPPQQSILRQGPPEAPSPPLQEQGANVYADWIEISSVRRQDPYLITLRTDIPKGSELILTGWSLESRVQTFKVPQGVKLVPAGLDGAVFAPIVLEWGDSVKISGAQNPFKPKFSFRPNACFGYLKETTEFPVSVPSSCPSDIPKIEGVSHLSPACQDFILDFDRCKEPPPYPATSSFANDLQCKNFYENLKFQLSYAGCVKTHKTEDDFFDNEWHIYVNEEERLIRSTHDRILLKDPDGVIIDEYVY